MKRKLAIIITLCVIVILTMAIMAIKSAAEEQLATAYAMCDPREGRNKVHVRAKPTKDSAEIGYLECGDDFLTDGVSRDGWIRCYGIGETSGWVYAGYVATEKPDMVMEQYCCVAKSRVAVRRWQGGPQIIRNGRKLWLNNCEDVTVFCIADGWACTSIGYIAAEWLEVDPL